MASFRSPAIRNLISGAAPYLRASQRRWAQVHDVRFLATQQPDRILERYKEKLARKAKEEGLRDVNELKEVYKEKIESLKKKATVEIPTADTLPTPPPSPQNASPFPPPPPPPTIPSEKPAGTPGMKTLSSYLDLEKVRELPPKEIEGLWRLRHVKSAQSLCASIPLPVYRTIESTAKKFPQFILPLPRENKPTEIHFLQWTFPAPDTVVVLFTHLAEYKVRGEYAEPHTTVTHHLELANEKELVLMKGDVMEGKGVSVTEAQWLILCLQRFYGEQGQEAARRNLLEGFKKGDERFNVEELVQEAEKVV
ncbi:F1F0 ATP synthase assembly protein-like protein Atp11 [Coleophoma crateriformis]|uniref:F1F0 ATP synthase assembly protein-like protein Atp11 n=1 Tax=Coleophoma crateriformis TaxID=565419 RepID=A0A3D8QQN1_9HELO|nr:F1F0 ATP synthase assembly protein-like protein Atp11 [Coleophoma crateriformis]